MQDGLLKAAELAGLPIDDGHVVEAINIYPRGSTHILPLPHEPVQELVDALSIDGLMTYFQRPMTMMPFEIRIW
jgi:hypothetical protein